MKFIIIGFLVPFLVLIAMVLISIVFIKKRKEEGEDKKGKGEGKEKKKFGWEWIVVVVILAIAGYQYFTKSSSHQQAPVISQNERIIEMIAKPNQWSENIQIPPKYWFRIYPEGKIKIKTWDGREIDDEPGKATWLGNEIKDANFRVKSREKEKDVKVVIILHQKT